MTDIGFAAKEVIAPQVCRLEVLAADKAEAYGLQIALKLKIAGGEHDGHTFTDYANGMKTLARSSRALKPGPSSRRVLVGISTSAPASLWRAWLGSSLWLRLLKPGPAPGIRWSSER